MEGTYIKKSKCIPSSHIISELCCHENLFTSSKTAPLCLRQVLVVKISII